MRRKNGISLIVLIITIIVLIILVAVVILTISKNNPIESAREAAFKEDVRTFQNDLAMYISKDYISKAGQRDDKIIATGYETDDTSLDYENSVYKYISSFSKKYENKLVIKNDELMYIEDNLFANDLDWVKSLNLKSAKVPVPDTWQSFIDSMTEDGVPIPKGFTYKEGTKETGVVIEDSSHNEFVWVPVDNSDDYKKDLSFSTWYVGSLTEPIDSDLPQNIDETLDVKKYHGFYIGRYEATVPEGEENPQLETKSKPTCKFKNIVWTNIDQYYSKLASERMYSWSEGSVVQSGLLTGKAWDTTCHWIEDYIKKINTNSSLNNSIYYGNYQNSESPANIGTYTSNQKQLSGANENWKTKNIYDLAGNVWEWTYERVDYSIR